MTSAPDGVGTTIARAAGTTTGRALGPTVGKGNSRR
jgi:hypothetical protein